MISTKDDYLQCLFLFTIYLFSCALNDVRFWWRKSAKISNEQLYFPPARASVTPPTGFLLAHDGSEICSTCILVEFNSHIN